MAEEGLLYDSATTHDDRPYFADVSGRPMLVLPYAVDTNDARFWCWKAKNQVEAEQSVSRHLLRRIVRPLTLAGQQSNLPLHRPRGHQGHHPLTSSRTPRLY